MKSKNLTAVNYLVKGLPMVYWEDPYYSDLLEQAKEMERQKELEHTLFIGKIAEIIGFSKTVELLKECKGVFKK
jgi:hypothetical protein